MDATVTLVALFGHLAVWAAVFNRVHSLRFSPRLGGLLTVMPFLFMVAVPAGYFAHMGMPGLRPLMAGHRLPWLWAAYGVFCWLVAVRVTFCWVRRQFRRPPAVLGCHRSQLVDLAAATSGRSAANPSGHWLLRLPGNEIGRLDLAEKHLHLPGLPAALDGLFIVHLSDLHFSGKVPQEYFHQMVDQVSQWEPDVVAITGDIVDKNAVLHWAPEVLGRLRARFGVYFILGNHDRVVDHQRLRAELVQRGLVDLGGRCAELDVRGHRLQLAGNELPWFGPAPQFDHVSHDGSEPPLRLLLAHTPDQLAWARSQQVALMLAGHLHGGQICIPLIGPILSPSRAGVEYSSGLFSAPPTLLHVTRGVSANPPVRLNCPPEVVGLVLRSPAEEAVNQPSCAAAGWPAGV